MNVTDYARLSYLLLRLKFADMPSYASEITEKMTIIVSTTTSKTIKRVSEYGGIGPIELWAIQQAIDSIAQNIRWTAK